MRKILFATTAIAAVTLASGAHAMESEMGTAMGNDVLLGGFYEFGFVSHNDDYMGPDLTNESNTYGNGKLFIDFENTADNGLTYGVHIDMPLAWWKPHGESHGGPFGLGPYNSLESSIFVAGDFGRAILGHDDYAYDYFVTFAPTHDGTWTQYDFALNPQWLSNGPDNATVMDDERIDAFGDILIVGGGFVKDTNDAKAVYLSPVFNGFQFGAGTQDDDKTKDNPLSFGASFDLDTDFGSLRVTGASYTNNQDTDEMAGTKKDTQTSIGLTYVWGDITATVSQTKRKNVIRRHGPNDNASTGPEVEVEQSSTEFGLGYNVNDAVSIGASLNNAETEGGTGAEAIMYEGTFTSLSGRYTIAPGLHTGLSYNLYELEDVSTAGVESPRNNEGTLLNWNIEFAF